MSKVLFHHASWWALFGTAWRARLYWRVCATADGSILSRLQVSFQDTERAGPVLIS